MSMTTPRALVSGRTAARLLGVSNGTVTWWVRKGKLTPMGKLDGSAFVFDQEYIEKRATELKAA